MEAEFSIVALTDDQSPAVARLCRDALDLPEDAAEAAGIVARLRDDTPPPASTQRRRTVGAVALTDGAVVGAALGSLAYRDPTVGHVDLLVVRPDRRRQGIGRALLRSVETALAAVGASQVRIAGNAPHYAWPGIDVRYTPAVCTALALGYTPDGTAWNMTADLSDESSPALRPTTGAEQRLAAQGVTVRRAGPADVAALGRFARDTFGGSWDAELAHSIGPDDAGCHLAFRTPDSGGEPELLGFAAYGSSRPSWFGPMGTAPAAEGLGIGGVLLRRCLRDQYAAGHRRAQIGWVGPVPFYARAAGATIERVFFLYRKQL
ncbi:GNAT family N-acetyltransferase [Plantactinospora sonchi]|uniref:GNAT family N-acetyltransferase n=1 Tax=Plantactinospora sonchi TaxID=1544735 RepID=A0ABU7RSN7_9ACTN